MLRPTAEAFQQCGLRAATDKIAVDSAWRLEHRKDVADRIAYLSRQEEDLIKAKRQRLEESLWHQIEADIGHLFETVEVPNLTRDGKPVRDKEGQRHDEQVSQCNSAAGCSLAIRVSQAAIASFGSAWRAASSLTICRT